MTRTRELGPIRSIALLAALYFGILAVAALVTAGALVAVR